MTRTLLPAVGRLLADPRPDAALVADFLRDADHPAFAELVRRHGPLVLGACRRTLGHAADADDAFQATFLVLVRRARRVAWRGSLGPWLYGVAVRVSRKARAARARRAAVERGAAMTGESTTVPPEPDDAAAVLDEELAALPEAVRVPLVLCELQGLSRRDAARQLGLAEGTLSSRLARGRKLLRGRLARRGVVPMAGGLCVAVPAELASATAGRAVAVISGAAGAVPAGILSLTDGVVKAMAVSSWKVGAVVVAVGVGMTGFGAWQGNAGPTATAAGPPATAAEKPETYYLIRAGGPAGGEQVTRVPLSGSETVVDAVGRLGHPAPDFARMNVWVARSTAGRPHQVLPVDWVGITERGDTRTNYQVLAGDRVYVGTRAADPPMREAKADPPAGPVATIFGDVKLSREEFAEYLIQRHGAKELEPFVNQRIVRDALGRQGYTVSGDEVTAALDADAKAAGLTRQQFVKDVLPRQGKTEAEWVEDVIVPRLMMAKLVGKRVGLPTEAELRRAFDRKHGPKVWCDRIEWPKTQRTQAEAAAALVKAGKSFDAAIRSVPPPPETPNQYAGARAEDQPYPRAGVDGEEALSRVLAGLKVGEVSGLIELSDRIVLLRAVHERGVDGSRSFEGEKPTLVKEVAEAKRQRAVVELFAELKREAKPEYHLTAPGGAGK